MVPLLFILPSQERPLQVPVSTLRCNRRTCCILTVLPWGHPASRRLSALLGSHVPQSPCPSPSSLHETMSGRLLCKTIPRVLSSSTLSFKNSTHYKICQKRLSVLFCLFFPNLFGEHHFFIIKHSGQDKGKNARINQIAYHGENHIHGAALEGENIVHASHAVKYRNKGIGNTALSAAAEHGNEADAHYDNHKGRNGGARCLYALGHGGNNGNYRY